MDSKQQVILWTSGQVPKSDKCKYKIFLNECYTHKSFEVLQSLRKDDILCDIRLKTDDGTIVHGHKVVLVSASPYFHAMFTSFSESNKDLVHIKELDSNALQLLVDYIYTGTVMVTEQNAEVLLAAANILQLDYVKDVCVDFLKTQLNPSNCFEIKRFADLHNCKDLLSSSDTYIKKEFCKVVKTDEFLSLNSEEVIKLISKNNINVPNEEEVYECVINWVKHELDYRYEFLPKLMEHVRLPLVSIEYISKKVVNEPLLKNSSKCTELLIEALHFNALTTQLQITIPQTIRTIPRRSKNKVILISSALSKIKKCYISIYDPETNLLRNIISEMTKNSTSSNLALIKKHLVFSFSNRKLSSVDMLNLSLQSPSWVKVVDMLVHRRHFGVGVLRDFIYAVGGNDFDNNDLNSTEVFYESCKKWQLVSRMSTKRSRLGVGTLNNLLYAVGGWNNSLILQSVECYDPIFNKWTTVANMSVSRADPGVGVLDGIMYVFGGFNHFGALKSAEAYSPTTGVWSFITDMHQCRKNPRVVTLNGLLYVIGGFADNYSTYSLKSIEIYDPDTNTWSIETYSSTSIERIVGAVVIDRSPHFKNN